LRARLRGITNLEGSDKVCRLEKGQLADLVDNLLNLGARRGSVGRVVSSRGGDGSRANHGSSDRRSSTELTSASLRGISAGHGHCV
jgi:hypothetical protein